MDTDAKAYIRRTANGDSAVDSLREGLSHYTEAFLDVINQGHPIDVPLIVAALISCTEIMKNSVFYKNAASAPEFTRLLLLLFRPQVEEVRTVIPRELLEKFRAMEQADAEAEDAEE